MKLLSCQDIGKVYGKKAVLDGICLSLEKHKIYGLIGRNGAGKTTLLGILSGQNSATAGRVEYGGEMVWENQRALNEICFSREINTSIMFGTDSRKVKALLKTAEIMLPHWDKDYADELVRLFEIEPNKKLNKLSKGMLSAVTIIIALASKAPLTFLDEPVAGLDVFMRDVFYKQLLQEFSRTERTFVVSTHIIDEAANMLENVIIMEKGKVIINENTEELLGRHRMVSGADTDIDSLSGKYKLVHSEQEGRRKTVCLEINDIDEFERDRKKYDVDVSGASLQRLFVRLLQV